MTLSPATTVVASPLTTYGNIGGNDSGMIFNDAMAFTKFAYMLTPSDYYTVTLYGTLDKRAYDLWRYNLNPNPYLPQWQGVAPTLPASSWFILPGPSEQTGTGAQTNPMVQASPSLTTSMPVLAIRAVLTAIGTAPAPTNTVYVSVLAVP
jgi:hypothetical protein